MARFKFAATLEDQNPVDALPLHFFQIFGDALAAHITVQPAPISPGFEFIRGIEKRPCQRVPLSSPSRCPTPAFDVAPAYSAAPATTGPPRNERLVGARPAFGSRLLSIMSQSPLFEAQEN